MTKLKSFLGVTIAALIFGLIVLAVETPVSGWQIAVGFFIFWPLTLGFANFRNAFFLLLMTLVLLLSVYLAYKYSWTGVVPGALGGIAVGLMMHFGWIIPHKPFSRTEYLASKK